MRYVELTAAERQAYLDGLARPHQVTAMVHLVDRDHRLVQDLSRWLVDGQTNLQDAPVTRTASAGFIDPDRDINDGDGFARHHMLQAWSLITVATLPEPVEVPVFCGPITGGEDDGQSVTVTCEDKAFLALTDVPSQSWEPKARVVDVVREILEATGETRFALPRGVTARVDDEVVIGSEEEIYPWTVAEEVAASAGYQLYYDAEGWVRMRVPPVDPSMIYRSDATDANVTERVATSWDWRRPNRVLYRGGAGVVARAVLPPRHPESPESLGRGGVPWRSTEIIENTKVKKRAAAEANAQRILKRRAAETVDVAFTAIAARHSDPRDLQRVETSDGDLDFILTEASIPWLGDTMSIGFHKRVSRPAKVRVSSRRRKPKKKDEARA